MSTPADSLGQEAPADRCVGGTHAGARSSDQEGRSGEGDEAQAREQPTPRPLAHPPGGTHAAR